MVADIRCGGCGRCSISVHPTLLTFPTYAAVCQAVACNLHLLCLV